MQDERVPKHDDECAVFLRVPAPEPAPRLIRPDATQHRADKAEQRGEANDAIDHPRQTFAPRRVQGPGEHTAHDVDERESASNECARVTQRHHDNVRGEPEIGVQHRPHHFHRVAAQSKVVGDDEGDETDTR